MGKIFVQLLVLACLITSGCSQSPDSDPAQEPPSSPDTSAAEPRQPPEQVAQAFFDAGNASDQEAFLALLTEAARTGLESGSGMQMTGQNFQDVEVGTATIDSDTADVVVGATKDGERQNIKLRMRDENNAWKVFALGAVVGDGMEMMIDLEKIGSVLETMVEGLGTGLQEAFQNALPGGNEDEIARDKKMFDALQTIDQDAYRAGWTNTEEFEGRPAGEALNALANQVWLTVHAGEFANTLDQLVSTKVSGLSVLEAIEKIANQVGLYPDYPAVDPQLGIFVEALATAMADSITQLVEVSGTVEDSPEPEEVPANAITLLKGPRPYPIVFTGPFLFTIEKLVENAPHATGKVNVQAKAFGLDAGMLSLIQEVGETTTITQVLDAKGRALRVENNVRYIGGGTAAGTSYEDYTRIDLRNLLREVETIASLAGTQRLRLPTKVETLDFTTLAEGAGKSLGDIRVTIKKLDKSTQFAIKGPEEALKDVIVRCWPIDADGNAMGIVYQGSDQWVPGEASAHVQANEQPSRIIMKIALNPELLEYPFELRDIPLTKFAEMPERIEKLSFEGHDIPLELTFREITTRSDSNFVKVMLDITNHSNKEATSAKAKFVYFDAAGTELKDFPHNITGAFTSQGSQSLAVAEQSSELETTAFFMPEETQTLRVDLEEVEFVDGTVWKKSE